MINTHIEFTFKITEEENGELSKAIDRVVKKEQDNNDK